jgi:hypothetical protein
MSLDALKDFMAKGIRQELERVLGPSVPADALKGFVKSIEGQQEKARERAANTTSGTFDLSTKPTKEDEQSI